MNNENLNNIQNQTNNEQPIVQNVVQDNNIQPQLEQNTVENNTQNIEVQPQPEQNNINNQVLIQDQLQTIPTVDQNPEQFINNVQNQTQEKKEEKKEGVSMVFIIILFVVILVSIYFLFPLLAKYV